MTDIATSPLGSDRAIVDRGASIITILGSIILALFVALLIWLPFDLAQGPEFTATYFGP